MSAAFVEAFRRIAPRDVPVFVNGRPCGFRFRDVSPTVPALLTLDIGCPV